MNKTLRLAQESAAAIGLEEDGQTGTLFGVRDGYNVVLALSEQSNQLLQVSVSVCQGGQLPDVKTLKAVAKSSKALLGCTVQRFRVTYGIRVGRTKAKTQENIRTALEDLTQFLHQNGFSNCCQQCGTIGETDAYTISGETKQLCPAVLCGPSN
ncbi:MAG: hypothetical protein PHE47_03205 [Oscillospiraceae bacterium]|nr:hypothetical protein [Oscillospiraceae bacterium]